MLGGGFGAGFESGVWPGVGFGAGFGLRSGLSLGFGLGSSLEPDLSLGLSLGSDLEPGLSLGFGLGSSLEPDLSLGFSLRPDLEPGLSLGFGLGSDLEPDFSLGFDLGSGLEPGLSLGFGLGSGLEQDLSLGENADKGERQSRMQNFIAVGIGGAMGAMMRYGAGLLGKTLSLVPGLPVVTILVNIVGSLLIGVASAYFVRQGTMGEAPQLFVMVGLMGGFTTFSSFSLETIHLMGEGRMMLAACNVLLSVGLCLLGVWLGKTVGAALFA